MLRNEIQIFFTALMFYTRIPCPSWVNHDADYLNKATRYFPLIGWIVGGACAAVFYVSHLVLSKELSIVLSTSASILITGAFHEDGFADVCDAFGGGWTKERILDIMKDSRVGAYGVIGMISILMFKFFVLMSLNDAIIPLALFAGHGISRFCAASFILTHEYVRENEDSKAKPIAKQVSVSNIAIAFLFGAGAMLVFKRWEVMALILPVYTIKYFLGRYFYKWIGGYTGDCLGTTQQVCEIGFYLSLTVLCKYILLGT
jgi:adenosylcobinamide-GDP ribazoletransferase